MKRLLRSDGFDVIVVGSGLAGLSAALTVAEFGYSPVILEKACEPGGLTRRAYGFFNAADARRQIALGIDDSPEKHLRQALEVSRGKAREPLMRTLCYEAYSTLQWLEALGLEFEPGIRRVLGGVYPRTHMPLRGAGEAYLSALRSALRPFGVPIVCNAEVTALRKSGDAVTGVEGLLSGEPFRLTSRLGVVLAGGGFSRNMEMMRLYAPGLSDVLPGADGSLIQAAADIGAALVGMSYFEVRLFASTLGLPGDPSDYILVNARGERFMREDRRRSTLAEAVVRQPDGMAWMVINAPGAEPLRPTTAFRETVIATISGYNDCIRTKERDSLGRDPLTMRPIGPGVEIRPVLPRILWSYGGLEINEKAEVIDRRGRPMKGLAAAGDITGGIHGEHAMRRLVNDGGNHLRENRNRAEVCAGDADEALGLRGIEDGRLEQVVEAVKQHDRLGQKGHGARRGHEAVAAAYEERLSEGLAKVREHAAGGRQAEVELLGADGQGLKAAERHEEEKVLLAQGGLNHGAGPGLKKKRRSGGCSELLLRQVL